MGRAIIGGLVGAVVGTALWLGIENVTGRDLVWLVLTVGLLSGLGVRVLSKERSSATGVIAAATALFGIIGGNIAQPFILDRMYDSFSRPIPSSITNSIEEETDVEDGGQLDTEEGKPAESLSSDVLDSDEKVDSPADNDSARFDKANEFLQRLETAVDKAGPQLAQASGPADQSTGLELVLYVVSAILAYFLGTGSKDRTDFSTEPPSPADS